MKIKALVDFATIGGWYKAGETHDVSPVLGKQWIAAHWAEAVKPLKVKSRRKAI